MKRDLDILKKLLAKIEEKKNLTPEPIELSEIGEDSINYHLRLLIDAEYIEAQVFGYGDVYPKRLTNKGHDFLELSRNETSWNKAKEIIKEKAPGVTLEIVKEVLSSITKSVLGLS